MTHDAYSFVLSLCKRKAFRTEAWPPGLVIELAEVHGIQFDDDRRWGAVFLQLARDGYIKRAGMFARESSNRSVRPGWIAV
jgi:hypothetical protein